MLLKFPLSPVAGTKGAKNVLRSSRIGKVLVIRCNLFLEKWIGFHIHKVLNILESSLYNAVIVCCAIELRAHDLVHQLAGFRRVVSLTCGLVSYSNVT